MALHIVLLCVQVDGPAMTQPINLAAYRRSSKQVYFNRTELSTLLGLYTIRVMRGEWRDYAIDHGVGLAVFSVYQHSHERPLFRVTKVAKGAGRPPDYAVFQDRRRLAAGSNLRDVLQVIDRLPRLVTGRAGID